MAIHTKQMQHFFTEHPGPFGHLESSDGVDGIMAVDCTSTGSYIVATHFWDRYEQKESTLIAEAVAFALNMLSSGQSFQWTQNRLPNSVRKLLNAYPGPFVSQLFECQYDGSSYVKCIATGQLLVKESRRGNDSGEIVTATVATALNALRKPRLLDTPRRMISALKCMA